MTSITNGSISTTLSMTVPLLSVLRTEEFIN